jgi:L-ascorbate metabolism protein UlaG (beta-lactamase superfamily)
MDGMRLITDPILRSRITFLTRVGPAVDHAHVQQVDAALISHLHYDHLDFPSLRKLPQGVKVVIPTGAEKVLRKGGFDNLLELEIGETVQLGPLSIQAVFADHVRKRGPVGPSADCVGYVIRGSSSVYFPGDTRMFPQMDGMTPDLDLALMPVWGWGYARGRMHMGPAEAAEALRLLRPRMAVPIHWGTFAPMGIKPLRPSFLFFPPLEFASQARERAPEVTIKILTPGESFEL